MNEGEGKDFTAGVARIVAEAAGVVTVHVVPCSEGGALLAEAAAGDRRATKLVLAIEHTLKNNPDCLLCFEQIATPRGASVILVCADLDVATELVGSAVCARCATRPDMRARVRGELQRVWGGRAIVPTHAAGHA